MNSLRNHLRPSRQGWGGSHQTPQEGSSVPQSWQRHRPLTEIAVPSLPVVRGGGPLALGVRGGLGGAVGDLAGRPRSGQREAAACAGLPPFHLLDRAEGQDPQNGGTHAPPGTCGPAARGQLHLSRGRGVCVGDGSFLRQLESGFSEARDPPPTPRVGPTAPRPSAGSKACSL